MCLYRTGEVLYKFPSLSINLRFRKFLIMHVDVQSMYSRRMRISTACMQCTYTRAIFANSPVRWIGVIRIFRALDHTRSASTKTNSFYIISLIISRDTGGCNDSFPLRVSECSVAERAARLCLHASYCVEAGYSLCRPHFHGHKGRPCCHNMTVV